MALRLSEQLLQKFDEDVLDWYDGEDTGSTEEPDLTTSYIFDNNLVPGICGLRA